MTSSDRSIPAANAHIASTPDSFGSASATARPKASARGNLIRRCSSPTARCASWLVFLSGTDTPQANEPEVDDADVMAALTLIPKARAEMEQLEALFLGIARERGMTWQDIAFGLGLGSTQAARQRYERLVRRTGG